MDGVPVWSMSTRLAPGLHVAVGRPVDTLAYDHWTGRWSRMFVPMVIAAAQVAPGDRILDVSTGTGEAALGALQAAGASGLVVGVDISPAMLTGARERLSNPSFWPIAADGQALPFKDASFDAVVCRLAAHHFADVIAAVKEMARVAKHRVVICDNTFVSESSEEADRVRDPSHVRNYSQPEWHSFFELAGLELADERYLERPLEIEPWLARVGCVGDDAARVRALLGDRVVDGVMPLPTLVLKGVPK